MLADEPQLGGRMNGGGPALEMLRGTGMNGGGLRSFIGKVGKAAKSLGFTLGLNEVTELAEKAAESLLSSGFLPAQAAGIALQALTPVVKGIAEEFLAKRRAAGATAALPLISAGPGGLTPELVAQFLGQSQGGRFLGGKTVAAIPTIIARSRAKKAGAGVFVS